MSSNNKDELKVLSLCFDIAKMTKEWFGSADAAISAFINTLNALMKASPDFVLLPEYLWLGLSTFFKDEDKLFKYTSDYFWQRALPRLCSELDCKERVIILGTAPFFDSETNRLYNRCPILQEGRVFSQTKLYLTPWEKAFSAGDTLSGFEYQGIRFSILICFDVEMPEISLSLRTFQPDLVFVPTTTENDYGIERIRRCASARAVELGSAVLTCHLRGQVENLTDLVSENKGGAQLFLPAQAAFANELLALVPKEKQTEFIFFSIPIRMIKASRLLTGETNPALVSKKMFYFKIE